MPKSMRFNIKEILLIQITKTKRNYFSRLDIAQLVIQNLAAQDYPRT